MAGERGVSIEKLGRCFVAVEGPRCSRKIERRLIEVLVIAVCAVIACAESWDDIALYGRSKRSWPKTCLDLPNGIPSHDTVRRVFMLIDPDAFEAGFTAWVGSLAAGSTARWWPSTARRSGARSTMGGAGQEGCVGEADGRPAEGARPRSPRRSSHAAATTSGERLRSTC